MPYSDIVGAFNSLVLGMPNPSGLKAAFDTLAVYNEHLHSGDEVPEPTNVGDLWFDSSVDRLKMWDGINWMDHATYNRITIKNTELEHPAIDFSYNSNHSNPIFKIETHSPTEDQYVTFGTTENYHEYAWKFDNDEEFKYLHGTNGEVCNINKDGITAPKVTITHAGGSYDVGNFIDTFESTLNDKLDETTFTTYVGDTPKIYYGDAEPSTPIIDGSIWYDSLNSRHLVYHSNAWVQTDRVEDTAMKTSLYNAVNNSTDYATLKSNLLTALS